MTHSVLISTLPPGKGGVPAKTEILAGYLRRRGHDVTIAHYATLSENSDLVAPGWRMLAGASPKVRNTVCFGDFPCIAIGCRFPELEFPYYLPSKHWRRTLASFDRHIAVGGTVLVSNPLAALSLPHMTWCASTMIDDRIDRRAAMNPVRRVVDRAVIGPVQRRMERRLLGGNGRFMAVSTYARGTLIAAGANGDTIDRVPIPVDTDAFAPPQTAPSPWQLGFAGRADDPRKNIGLLFEAISVLVGRGLPVRLKLTGDPVTRLAGLANRLGISDRLEWTGWLADADLPSFYRSLDVFVFSSGKEGLGLSGVQAMACGVPVVSTRCGGPEDYVVDGRTGKLSGDTAGEMADAIEAVASSREDRNRLGADARLLVERDYGFAAFEDGIARNWAKTWGDGL